MIRTRRRGSAPLEVVMVFPTLVLLLAAILSVGAAGTARTAALSDARGEGWNHRPGEAVEVLKLDHDPALSAVEHTEKTPLALAAFGRKGQVAVATVVVQDRPWAHEDLPFPVLPAADGIAPHAGILDQLARTNTGPVADAAPVVGELNAARFLDPAVKPK